MHTHESVKSYVTYRSFHYCFSVFFAFKCMAPKVETGNYNASVLKVILSKRQPLKLKVVAKFSLPNDDVKESNTSLQ